MNADAPEPEWPSFTAAKVRVLEIQAKLHRWATDDSDRQFSDLFNLVCDPAFLLTAWDRVRNNRGARSAGAGMERVLSMLSGVAWTCSWPMSAKP